MKVPEVGTEYLSRLDTVGGPECSGTYDWVSDNPFNAGSYAANCCWATSWMCLRTLVTSLGLADLGEHSPLHMHAHTHKLLSYHTSFISVCLPLVDICGALIFCTSVHHPFAQIAKLYRGWMSLVYSDILVPRPVYVSIIAQCIMLRKIVH